MKQHNIDNTLVLVQQVEDNDEWLAWTDQDDPVWAYGATEQQAVNALRVKLYNDDLTPEADQVYQDFFAGKFDRPVPAIISRQQSAYTEPMSRQRVNVWKPGSVRPLKTDAPAKLSDENERGDWPTDAA